MATGLAIAGAAVAIALALGRLLRRRRSRRRGHGRQELPEELAGLLAGGFALARPDLSRSYDEELELEEGALDPDELEGDPLVWDEGADDELG